MMFHVLLIPFLFVLPVTITQPLNRALLLQQSSSSISNHKLTANPGRPYEYFGGDNAIAMAKNRIVIGAYGVNQYQGAVYVFSMEPSSSYTQMTILVAHDGIPGDSFGVAVDTDDGDWIVVGASYSNTTTGAVYVFRWQTMINFNNNYTFSTFSQVAKLTAENGRMGDYFGSSVTMAGNFILVGAPYADTTKNATNATLVDVGAAYLFAWNYDDESWTQIMQLQPNDGKEFDSFGLSVALMMNEEEDDTDDGRMTTTFIATVGTLAANAVYVFTSETTTTTNASSSWTQTAKLMGPSSGYSTFGKSMAITTTTHQIVIGAPYDDTDQGINVGSVFVFTKIKADDSTTTTLWTQTNKLLAMDGAAEDSFGASLAISKDASTLAVGAYSHDASVNTTNAGAAYLFRTTTADSTTTGMRWTQIGKFVAADQDNHDFFGISIAIENSTVVVGASGDNSGTGAVYVIDAESITLAPTTTTAPSKAPVTRSSTFLPLLPDEATTIMSSSIAPRFAMRKVLSYSLWFLTIATWWGMGRLF